MRRRQAFTLVEVLFAIAVFILLVGGIFGVVQTAFISANDVARYQFESERFNAFQQFLRRLFLSLPPDATVDLRIRSVGGQGDYVELLIEPVPDHMLFGAALGDGLALSAVPDGHGSYTFSIGYFDTKESQFERDERLESMEWMPLLPGVEMAKWRFADARNPILSETWQEASGRPGLAELEIAMTDGMSATFDFWVPPLAPRQRIAPGGPVERDGNPQGDDEGQDGGPDEEGVE